MMRNIHLTSIYIIVCLITFSCEAERPPKRTTQKKETSKQIAKPTDINTINFYFENSKSMKGYLNGDNFQQTVRRILNNSQSDSLNSFFVNTKEYFQSNIKDRIAKKDIKSDGTRNSDHQFIFTNAIKNAVENDLSIVITDGIYSMKDGNIAIVEVDIEAAFTKALKANEIETVVLKMSSNFNGTYYFETCKPGHKAIKINQIRPYYIFLFGSKEVINKTLKDIVIIDDLSGYEEQARFMITKDLNVPYTVLPQGEEKKGGFRQIRGNSKNNSVVKEIGEAEKFSERGVLLKDSYLQFGIAVDYSNSSIPESYRQNISNYTIEDNTGYSLQEIKKVEDLDKTSKSYKWIDAQNKKGNFKYTHIIVVKGKTNLYGDLNLSFDINFPKWIANTGTSDDCDIKNDTSTTFAFDRLIIGISKAYEKTNDKEDYFKLKIKIKAD